MREKNVSLFYTFGTLSVNIHINNIVGVCFVAQSEHGNKILKHFSNDAFQSYYDLFCAIKRNYKYYSYMKKSSEGVLQN